MVTRDGSGGIRERLTQPILAVLAVYLYVFMEWLFFVTKPSFMSVLGPFESVRVLLAAPLPLAAAAVAAVLVLWMPMVFTRRRAAGAVASAAARFVPSALLAGAMILLIDNFTYTIFKFGVRTTHGWLVHLYAVLAVILLVVSFFLVGALERRLGRPAAFRTAVVATPVLVLLSVLAVFRSSDSSGFPESGGAGSSPAAERRPNILLISGDGLNAAHMSVYGYPRKTTPFLESLAKDALVCENCFTNAGTSAASIVSMLTGKLPTETRVVYPPEILRGRAAYQHLPGILRYEGYRNVDISIRRHADPVDLNMRNSFHWANFREIKGKHVYERFNALLGQEGSFFVGRMIDRITERLLHITGVRSMGDPLAEVVKGRGRSYNKDGDRLKTLFRQLGESSAPLFVHMHLLGTHGPAFEPVRRVFSRGEKQDRDWMTDFYDDAILTFDNHVKSVVRQLVKQDILDDTVIVIFSDHGQGFSVNARLPLIFIFPGGEHRGRIAANVQNLDIAATVLDYLGIEQPGWMGGQSLLSPARIDRLRIIYSADPKHRIVRGVNTDEEDDGRRPGPPFYSLQAMGAHCCQNYYELDLRTRMLTVSTVAGHTSPCAEDELPSPEEVGELIIGRLEKDGYDTASIERPLMIRHSGR